MAESAGGSSRSNAIPGNTGLDQTRDGTVSLLFTNLNTINERALAFGSAASSPATFGDLHGSVQKPLSDTAPVRTSIHPGGPGYDATVSLLLVPPQLAAMTSGEHVYACLFAVDPAISGSVPDLVVDLGVLS